MCVWGVLAVLSLYVYSFASVSVVFVSEDASMNFYFVYMDFV